ncbi:hypothetical protein QTP70_017296 [Hemibagrus guttatus]|uniref:Uncharacterized protein n=1 Tax=Hemibagrus guttatus TaxID=175788 RepID=A0AAE0RD50_9TELE|nr:hypothetical protein QTP70_017296 [Hemibagrus guttatus]
MNSLIYSRVTGSLCLSQASLGIKAGYTLDRVPTHRRAHTHTHTHSHSLTHYGEFRDANQPTMHVFVRHGENMQIPNTHGGGGNRTPNPGDVRVMMNAAFRSHADLPA